MARSRDRRAGPSSSGSGSREALSRCVHAPRLVERTALFQFVHYRLVFDRWSPQQIAARRRSMHPDHAIQRISHETIYAAIYAHPRGGLKQTLVQALRQGKPRRGRALLGAGRSAYRASHLPGHWEGDLIKGAFNRSCVGTLVERKTRFVVLCKMDGCTAKAALEGFTRQMSKLPAFLRERLTHDRRTELTCHEDLMRRSPRRAAPSRSPPAVAPAGL